MFTEGELKLIKDSVNYYFNDHNYDEDYSGIIYKKFNDLLIKLDNYEKEKISIKGQKNNEGS